MKKIFAVTTILVLLVATVVFAADTNARQNRQRQRDQICSKVFNSPQEELTGTVADIGTKNGIILEVGGEQVKIYGLGPNWYWESLGIDKPEIADLVTITVYAVPFWDATRYVAASVTTVDGTLIQLRDPNTGCPLWLSYKKP